MSREPSRRTAPSDDYEAKEMAGSAPVLHRDKHVSRGTVLAMIPMSLLLLLASVGVALGGDKAAPPAAALIPFGMFLLLAFVALTRSVVRTVVTTRELQVHWGLWGPRVPLGAITKCEAQAPNSMKGPPQATFAWNTLASRGSVLLEWVDAKGAKKALMFPADDPPALVEQVERARSAAATSAGGVRVASAEAGADTHQVERAINEEKSSRSA